MTAPPCQLLQIEDAMHVQPQARIGNTTHIIVSLNIPIDESAIARHLLQAKVVEDLSEQLSSDVERHRQVHNAIVRVQINQVLGLGNRELQIPIPKITINQIALRDVRTEATDLQHEAIVLFMNQPAALEPLNADLGQLIIAPNISIKVALQPINVEAKVAKSFTSAITQRLVQ